MKTLIAFLLLSCSTFAQVGPKFSAIACATPSIDGVRIPVGDTLKYYDIDGVLCGLGFIVHEAASGSVLPWFPAYGDDSFTPNRDEGAEEGEWIRIVYKGEIIQPISYTNHSNTLPGQQPTDTLTGPWIFRHANIFVADDFTKCCGIKGDINSDASFDILDLQILIDHMFISSVPLYCPDAADANNDGSVDILDLQLIINSLFITEDPLEPCE